MKKILLVFALIAITLFGCNKQASNQLAPKYTVAEVKSIFKIDLIALENQGMASRGKPSNLTEATLVEVSVDLNADVTGATLTGDVSSEAYVAGGQKFIDTITNDGAIGLWECNRSYSSPGAGVGATTVCQTQGTAWYRVFSADFVTYKLHLSYFKQG